MRILITGALGQLGKEVTSQLSKGNHIVKAANSSEFDITNKSLVIKYFEEFCPDVVINCASYTAVDECEMEEGYIKAYAINVEAVRNLALECNRYNSKFVHFSSDYVFDGMGDTPIQEEMKRNPINKYGLTKKLSEDEALMHCDHSFIIRTSWLFGDGNNFVNTMLKIAQNNSEINVVGDQFGCPTSTKDLTWVILKLIETDNYGIYHGTNNGFCSWYDFAIEIFRLKNIKVKVNKVTSDEFKRLAKRPKYSVLDNKNLRNIDLDLFRSWQEGLKDYLIG